MATNVAALEVVMAANSKDKSVWSHVNPTIKVVVLDASPPGAAWYRNPDQAPEWPIDSSDLALAEFEMLERSP
jgi:hypothetical protein